jgi:hypothetical protein
MGDTRDPRSGVRPQAAINDELVRISDILVGMFWTKLGTHTGVAESGTVEEIDQFVAAAKPAMLYFSRRPIDPNAINVRQQRRLERSRCGGGRIHVRLNRRFWLPG